MHWPFTTIQLRAPSSMTQLCAVILFASLFGTGCEDVCCESDSDCSGAVCFEGACHAPCVHDSQCREGEMCLNGACLLPSRSNSHCTHELNFDTLPEPTASVQPEPEPSAEPEPGPEPEDCPADAFEPNDAYDDAPITEPGDYDLTLCNEREDWFLFQGTGALETTVTFGDDIDIDIEMYNGDGVLVDISNGVGTSETVTALDNEQPPFRLRVFRYAGGSGTYTLSAVENPGICLMDDYEPNQTPSQGFTVASDGVLFDATLCSGDIDTFGGGNNGEAFNVFIDNGDTATILGQTGTWSDLTLGEFQPLTVTPQGLRLRSNAGDAWFAVTSTNVGGAGTAYSFVVESDAVDCGHLEPNDEPQFGPGAPLPFVQSSRLCAFDVDIYEMEPGAGAGEDLELSFWTTALVMPGSGARAGAFIWDGQGEATGLIELFDVGAPPEVFPVPPTTPEERMFVYVYDEQGNSEFRYTVELR